MRTNQPLLELRRIDRIIVLGRRVFTQLSATGSIVAVSSVVSIYERGISKTISYRWNDLKGMQRRDRGCILGRRYWHLSIETFIDRRLLLSAGTPWTWNALKCTRARGGLSSRCVPSKELQSCSLPQIPCSEGEHENDQDGRKIHSHSYSLLYLLDRRRGAKYSTDTG